MVDCSVGECETACFILYPTANCGSEPDFNLTSLDIFTWETYAIGDTAGVITPFNLTSLGSVPQIKSIGYVTPSENKTGSCPYLQFGFFTAENQTAGYTYITPGQLESPCIQFDGNQVTAYSGVTMLIEVPEHILGWAESGNGNVLDEGLSNN
jgi:hypothetical protein